MARRKPKDVENKTSSAEAERIIRRVTYRLYPSKAQELRLLEIRKLHQQLYNAALEERIQAY